MKLRPATFADEALLLEWRNEPQARANSSYTGEVTPEGHHAWLQRAMQDHETHLYIAEVNGLPVGQGRIERAWKAFSKKMDSACIGYSIDVNERGKGHGKQLAEKLVNLAKHTHGYGLVMCRIKRGNMCSVRTAITAGVNTIELF
jgi:RimJ/RimL family protein N-acetyltransferase